MLGTDLILAFCPFTDLVDHDLMKQCEGGEGMRWAGCSGLVSDCRLSVPPTDGNMCVATWLSSAELGCALMGS